MKIGQFVEYKGYIGTIEYSEEDKIYHGELLNTENSIVGYHANNVIELFNHYCLAVDDHIDLMRKK